MIKKFGLTFGGLQQKIVNIVFLFALAILLVFTAVSYYMTAHLRTLSAETRTQQETAISEASVQTMHQMIEVSLVQSNSMEAYIVDDLFTDVKNDVRSLQTLAAGIFSNRDSFAPGELALPDAKNEGTCTVQVLYGAGVDYTASEDLGIAAHMSDPMLALAANSTRINSCFIALTDGTFLIADAYSASKLNEDGSLKSFEARERPWYKKAVENGDVCFSDIDTDTFTGKIEMLCAAPVYVKGKMIGVVGADLFLDSMEQAVNESVQNGSFVCIVNENGQIIFSPMKTGVFRTELAGNAVDLRSSDEPTVASFITQAMTEQTGLHTVQADGKSYYMAGAPARSIGWTVLSGVDKAVTEQPAEVLLENFKSINADASDTFNTNYKHSQHTALVLTILVVLLGAEGALLVANRIVKPVEHMTRRIQELNGTDLSFHMEDIYHTNDEIEVLAEAFDQLTRRAQRYIQDITEITKEKERIGAELELARKIQNDMLPSLFPPFPDRREFDIYAVMDPAKEVGGDFYDFYLIDDDHLGMVIADVSGKGVPAALFMMMTKILISYFAMAGSSPKEVLEKTNAAICRNNKEKMFVTTWFGILELSTGKVTAANAGHEYPIIRKPDGVFELMKDKHDFVLGGIARKKYKEYEFTLERGATLFLYTDGVPEATDGSQNFFESERLLKALNADPAADPKHLLHNVRAAVDAFVGDAPQFDDLTMLAVTLNPDPPET